jgi:hypothetical protein
MVSDRGPPKFFLFEQSHPLLALRAGSVLSRTANRLTLPYADASSPLMARHANYAPF